MSTKDDSAIDRIARRVERLQDFIVRFPDATLSMMAEKQSELADYQHALSVLIAHRAMEKEKAT